MGAKSTKDLEILLEKAGSTPVPLVPTAITSAKPAVVTVANTLADGDAVYCSNTGFAELDGKWFVLASVTALEFSLLGSDTLATIDTLAGSPTMEAIERSDMIRLCLASLVLNVDEPGTISVGTYCDTTASIPSIVVPAGTETLAGFVNIADEDYQELLAAKEDGNERIQLVMLPDNGYLVAPVTFSQIAWELPLDGATGYTATAVLSTEMVHQF